MNAPNRLRCPTAVHMSAALIAGLALGARLQAGVDVYDWGIQGAAGLRTLDFTALAVGAPANGGLVVAAALGRTIRITPVNVVAGTNGRVTGTVEVTVEDPAADPVTVSAIPVTGTAMYTETVDTTWKAGAGTVALFTERRKILTTVKFTGKLKQGTSTTTVTVSGKESYTEETAGYTSEADGRVEQSTHLLPRQAKGLVTQINATVGSLAKGKATVTLVSPVPEQGAVVSTAATFMAANSASTKWTGDAVAYVPVLVSGRGVETVTVPGGTTSVTTAWAPDTLLSAGRLTVKAQNRDAGYSGSLSAQLYSIKADMTDALTAGTFDGIPDLWTLDLTHNLRCPGSNYTVRDKFDAALLRRELIASTNAHGLGFPGLDETIGAYTGAVRGSGESKVGWDKDDASANLTVTLDIERWVPIAGREGFYVAEGTVTASGFFDPGCRDAETLDEEVTDFDHSDGVTLDSLANILTYTYSIDDGIYDGRASFRGRFVGNTIRGSASVGMKVSVGVDLADLEMSAGPFTLTLDGSTPPPPPGRR